MTNVIMMIMLITMKMMTPPPREGMKSECVESQSVAAQKAELKRKIEEDMLLKSQAMEASRRPPPPPPQVGGRGGGGRGRPRWKITLLQGTFVRATSYVQRKSFVFGKIGLFLFFFVNIER